MIQNPPEKKKGNLPDDVLEHGDRHLMESIFGEEIMSEVDKVIAERSEGDEIGDELFMP